MRKFTLGLNAATIIDYNKNCFKENLFKIKFKTKKLLRVSRPPPPRGVELAAPKIFIFKMWQCTTERKFTSGLNAAKITDYNKKCFK